MVWSGTRMLVWGGEPLNDDDYTSAVYAYDPATGTWSSYEADGPPSRRTEAVAVWKGREMLVWGGTCVSRADVIESDLLYVMAGGSVWGPDDEEAAELESIGAGSRHVG